MNHRVSDDWVWGSSCDIKIKKRDGERLEPLRVNNELPANKVDYWLLIAGSWIWRGDCKEQAAERCEWVFVLKCNSLI